MDLLSFLRTIPADPADPGSPDLYVVLDDLSTTQESYVLGSTYARRPYAVVIGLPENRADSFNDGSATFSTLIDVHLLHPATAAGERPSKRTLRHVVEHATLAHRHVDALPSHALLVARFTLETVMPPQERDGNALEATLRYRATIHRP